MILHRIYQPLEKRITVTSTQIQLIKMTNTVKLRNKERFDKEQIGIKEPFPVTNLPFTS